MRTVAAAAAGAAVKDMCMRAGTRLPDDVARSLAEAAEREESATAKEVFRQLLENIRLAGATGLPLCQDTGLAVFFVEIGREVWVDGDLTAAINEGVRQGYREAFLRASVCDPFTRGNTGDNTPAIIHYDLVPGDRLRILFMAKGGGAENMSRVFMLTPADGWEGIRRVVVNRVAESHADPCPPIIVGVGIGGNFEYAALLAKKALLRKLDDVHPDPESAAKERELASLVNALNIGPMGLGGKTTTLGVKILTAPCHIASLPVAVNIQCHSSRHEEAEL